MDTSHTPRNPALVEDLTERELDVLRLKAQNRSNQEIADELMLALSTVKWYVGQIYGKLGVKNQHQAIARAQALELIEGTSTRSIRPRHNLPAQTTPFIGREQERADLDALLANPDVRLITILAPGGMGKTRLGLVLAEAHLDRFADGVYMVSLAPLREPDQIVAAIADATSFPFMGDNRSPKEQVLDFLRNKHMLLMLDNFEHLLDGTGLVMEILRAAPAVQVVVTSRERLNLSGEAVYTVGGMGGAGWETPEEALANEAVWLFIQRAELVSPGFELNPDNLPYLARICQLVDGMPLGIVLAAAWTEVLSLAEIAHEIQGSLDFLAGEICDQPRRQWSIRALFDPTWNRLTDAERDVFTRFSMFRGGATRNAVQAVTGADLHTLQTLIKKALLEHEPAGRYQVHELLRQYSAEQLEIAGKLDATLEAHCAHYADFMHAREDDLRGGDRQLAALGEIEIDFENVQAAWLWAIEQRRSSDLLSMAWPLWYFLDTPARHLEGYDLFQAALAVDEDPVLQGWVMAYCGYFHVEISKPQKADIWYLQSLKVGHETDNQPLLAFVLSLRSRVLAMNRTAKDMEEAAQLSNDSLRIYQELDDSWGILFALDAKNFIAWAKRDFQSMRTILEDMLPLARQSGDQRRLASVLDGLSIYYWGVGDYGHAQQYSDESLAISRELNEPAGIAHALDGLGWIADAMGNTSLALQYFQEAADIYRELGSTMWVSPLMKMAHILARTGEDEEVDEIIAEVSHVIESMDSRFDQSRHRFRQVQIAYARRDFPTALRFAQSALEYAQSHHIHMWEPAIWLWIGLCEVRLGQCEAAREHLLQCLPGLTLRTNIPKAIFGLASVAEAQDQAERAVELAALVHYHPITEHEFKVYAWDLLTDLEAALPADMYAAAVERGAAFELDAIVADLSTESTLYHDDQPSEVVAQRYTTSPGLDEPLTDREFEVLVLIADGLTNQQIADQLYIAISTVKKHINHIYSKLDVTHRAQAIARARTLSILS